MAARRRAEMVEETRAKLVRAARAAFATKGYAAASMDDLTAEAGLTRGALYHNFGDKKGLMQAVVDQIDAEMLARMRTSQEGQESAWSRFLGEGVAYIEMALEPEIQRIMLLDGPAVLGDPSRWPNQTTCLRRTTEMVQALIDEGTVKPMDAEAAARLYNGAALNAALWIAAADDSHAVLAKAVEAFRHLAAGLLRDGPSPSPAKARKGEERGRGSGRKSLNGGSSPPARSGLGPSPERPRRSPATRRRPEG